MQAFSQFVIQSLSGRWSCYCHRLFLPFCRPKGGSVLTNYLLLTLVDVDSLSSRLWDIDAVKVGLQCEVDSDDTENKRPELPS